MLTKLSRLFYGWRMIAVASALRILGGGLYYYGFTVFFLPVSRDLGLTRAATSLVFSLARAQGAFEGPVAGYFMDRFGPRPLIITAIIMTSIGHMLLSGVHSYLMLILVYMGEGIVRVMSDSGASRLLAAVELLLALAYFYSALRYARIGRTPSSNR